MTTRGPSESNGITCCHHENAKPDRRGLLGADMSYATVTDMLCRGRDACMADGFPGSRMAAAGGRWLAVDIGKRR